MEVPEGRLATKEEVNDLKSKMNPSYIDWKNVREIEEKKKHDVVAHAEQFREQCPLGGRLIHIALTARDVTDNVELYQMKQALQRIHERSVNSLRVIKGNVEKYRNEITVAQTHLQKADLITEGFRFAEWATPLIYTVEQIEDKLENFKGRGLVGATGNRSQLINLFDGDRETAKKVNDRVMQKMGFKGSFIVTGQQYPREYECEIFAPLSIQCANMHKVAEDIRILQHDGEMEEPIGEEKTSSSSMPGKRNPNLSERMSGLSTYVNHQIQLAWDSAANVKLEGDVRDSIMRRMYPMEIMLGMDALHTLYQTVMDGITVYDKICKKIVKDSSAITSLQTMVTEAAKRGGNKLELHTKARDLAMKDFELVRVEGKESRLVESVKQDDLFGRYLKPEEIDLMLDPVKRLGDSQKMCDDFIKAADEILKRNEHVLPVIIKAQL
jgi:adenylosuccinate lyase